MLLKSNFNTIVDLFFKAKTQLIISMPNITLEIAEAIISTHNRGVKVHLFIEFSEQSYRAGYGEIKAIERLKRAGINFSNKAGINIYFIITDNEGYFYFPKSLFFEKEGTTFDLFPMEKIQVKTLKVLFKLGDEDDFQTDEIIEKVGIETLVNVSIGIGTIDEDIIEKLVVKLKADPVIKPDFARILDLYIAKFQIVELKFNGGNLHKKKIKLFKDLINLDDEELLKSIDANLKLFDNLEGKEFFKPFLEINKKYDVLRKKYIYHLTSREKCIIKRSDKEGFEKEIENLQKEIEKLTDKLLNDLQIEIEHTSDVIKKSLLSKYTNKPPKEFEGYSGDTLKKLLEKYIEKKVSFPNSKDLLENINLENYYYNITWEDLNNPKVLKEMQKQKLINSEEKSYFEELVMGTQQHY